MPGRMQAKVVLVIGGGAPPQGLNNGKAAALLYAREGAVVVVADRDLAAAQRTRSEIMAQGGIARRIINMVMAIVGGIRGSLAVTTVAASELFGAMSHTAVGTVVAMGRMIYPALKDGGYNERFSVGLIASSGAIAVVIPPSIAIVQSWISCCPGRSFGVSLTCCSA